MLEVLKHDGLLLALALEFDADSSPSEAHPIISMFSVMIETIFKALFLIPLLHNTAKANLLVLPIKGLKLNGITSNWKHVLMHII